MEHNFPFLKCGLSIITSFQLLPCSKKKRGNVTLPWRKPQTPPQPGEPGQHSLDRQNEKGTSPLWSSAPKSVTCSNHKKNARQILTAGSSIAGQCYSWPVLLTVIRNKAGLRNKCAKRSLRRQNNQTACGVWVGPGTEAGREVKLRKSESRMGFSLKCLLVVIPLCRKCTILIQEVSDRGNQVWDIWELSVLS